jgi:hypothetical protein
MCTLDALLCTNGTAMHIILLHLLSFWGGRSEGVVRIIHCTSGRISVCSIAFHDQAAPVGQRVSPRAPLATQTNTVS